MRCLVSLSLALALSPAVTLSAGAAPPERARPAAPAGAAEERPSVRLTEPKAGSPAAVEVVGLPKELHARMKAAKPTAKDWHPVFRVVVAGGTNEEVLARTPLSGTYALTDTGIRFEPQFALVPGQEYVAIVHDLPDGKPMLAKLALPKPPPGPRVGVVAVYPTTSRLPENTLRLYVHFSGPVRRGNVYRHMKLVRDDGAEVKDPFLELEEELWSADGLRLTVLFHPGRVKRGLVPREEEGPILEDGHTYTFVVSEKWEDSEGRPLTRSFTKTFTAGPPDDRPVDLSVWALMAPRARSDSPLIVRLPKPLDHAMLGRVVWVEDAAGKQVPGTLTVGGGERVLTFQPKEPWARGEYKLVADTRLEDVCGNRVGEPFEVDVFKPVTPRIEVKYSERKFTVR